MTPRPHHSLHSPFKIPSHPYPNQSSVPLDCFPYCNDTSLIKISPHHFNWCRVYSCLKTHITAWINLQRIMLSEKKSIPIILYNCKQTFLKWHEKRGTDEWLPRVKDRMCVGVQEGRDPCADRIVASSLCHQCQDSASDVVWQWCKMLLLVKSGQRGHQIFLHYFS